MYVHQCERTFTIGSQDRNNGDCFGCHVEGQLRSFHGKEVVKIAKKSNATSFLTVSLLILIGIVILLLRKQ